MNEGKVKEFLSKKLSNQELVNAAWTTRHKQFGYKTYSEYVAHEMTKSAMKPRPEDECWKDVMDFLEKIYGA